MSYDSTILADSPVGYWRLEESTGTTAGDDSGNSYSGTYNGGVTLANAAGPITTDGAANVAPLFNGSTGYVDIPFESAFALNGGAFSVEFWFNPTSLSNIAYPSILSHYPAGGSSGQGWLFFVYVAAHEFAFKRDNKQPFTSTAPSTGSWVHCVVTYDGTNLRYYFNAVQDASSPVAESYVTDSSTSNLYIAQVGSNADYFEGYVSHVALYNTTLSPTRISAHYAAATGTIALAAVASVTVAAYQPTVTTSATANAGLASVSVSACAPGAGPVRPTAPVVNDSGFTGWDTGGPIVSDQGLAGYNGSSAPVADAGLLGLEGTANSGGTTASAGVASVTATAYDPALSVNPSPVLANVSVAADGPTPEVTSSSGLANSIVAANTPTPEVGAAPSVAAVTVAAYQPTVTLAGPISPGLATITLTAASVGIALVSASAGAQLSAASVGIALAIQS